MNDEIRQSCLSFQKNMRRFSMVFTAGIGSVLGRGGISLPQYNALSVLQDRGPMKMGEFAKFLGVTVGAATNLADKLVDTGSIARKRDDGDRRVVRVGLTAKGRRQVQDVDDTFFVFCSQIMEQLDPATRTSFVRDFDVVLDHMQEHCAPHLSAKSIRGSTNLYTSGEACSA